MCSREGVNVAKRGGYVSLAFFYHNYITEKKEKALDMYNIKPYPPIHNIIHQLKPMPHNPRAVLKRFPVIISRRTTIRTTIPIVTPATLHIRRALQHTRDDLIDIIAEFIRRAGCAAEGC